MDKLPLIQIIVIAIPEAIAVTFLSTSLFNHKQNVVRKVIIGVLTAIISNIIRPHINEYLVNVLTYNFILILSILFLLRTNIFDTITGVLVSSGIYTVIEYININVIVGVLRINPTTIIEKFPFKIVLFLPQLFATLLMLYMVEKFALHIT